MNQLVTQLETGVLDLCLLGLAVGLGFIGKHVKSFVAAHTTTKQREVLGALINDAVPYVKVLFPQADIGMLLTKATDHVVALATQKGITVNQTEVSAAVASLLSATAPRVTNNVTVNNSNPQATAAEVAHAVASTVAAAANTAQQAQDQTA